MKLYEISDSYINYMLSFFHSTMLENKEETRVHSRKYLGVIISINGYNYFAPLSSPKDSDYKDGVIRANSSIVFRMVKDYSTKPKLLGTIKFNNMIPAPNKEIKEYDYDNELDLKYKNLVLDELNWINHNITKIRGTAKRLYNSKLNESTLRNANNKKYYDSIMPFSKAEEKCSLWDKTVGIKENYISYEEVKKTNDHIRHKDEEYEQSMIEGKYFVYKDNLYRIDKIELKPLGSDSAILTKLTISGEEKYIDNNFTSDAKFNLHLQKIDSKILSNFKDNKNR